MLTQSAILHIISAGGSIIVDSKSFTESALVSFASALHGGATLTLKNTQGLTESTLRRIAAAKPGQVIIDFYT